MPGCPRPLRHSRTTSTLAVLLAAVPLALSGAAEVAPSQARPTQQVAPATADAAAQTAASPAEQAKRRREQAEARLEAHKGDFDYLLGDWEFTAARKTESGEQKFRGYWSAVRLDEGQVLDEYRVVSDQGETWYVTTTLRNYNAFLDRWELVGADAGTGLQDFGTARREGDEMRIEQRFGVASGDTSSWRIRYHAIQPDRFSWVAARSTDGGATWVEGYQTIEARRIGKPRSLGPLAPARN